MDRTSRHPSKLLAPRASRLAPRAFTLVELLVVIAIIGVLVALLLPAIQAAREAARRSQCSSNLRQLAIGAQNYHDSAKSFPTGGWGWFWVGDADRGNGRDQPGGWVFNLLPFVEQDNLHALASDGDRENITVAQRTGTLSVVQSPLDLIRCPSRRIQNVYPKPVDGTYYANNCLRATGSPVAGRSDYAINCGDRNLTEGTNNGSGPNGMGTPTNHAAAATYAWQWTPQGSFIANSTNEVLNPNFLSGISFSRSEVGIEHITDGTSTTYLIGEKYMNPVNYETGQDSGDNETWCTGFNNDNFRCAFDPPLVDTPGLQYQNRFGSAHATGWFVSWCDGHVDFQTYEIDQFVHRGNANRTDAGRPFGAPP